MSATDQKHEHWTVSHPKTLKDVLQVYADRDLEAHLRAVKLAFPRATIVAMCVNPRPDKKPKKLRKAEQVSLF